MRVNYSKELMESAVKGSYSIADVCRKIGLKPIGGNYSTVRKKIDQYNLDVSHFTGQSWNKGKGGTELTTLLSLNDILQENVNYSSDSLRKRLINASLKLNICEQCGILGSEVNLELHHINGDHYDNRLENLLILCPNCHSKTDNFRGRGSVRTTEAQRLHKKKDHTGICDNCGKEFYKPRLDKSCRFCCRECYNEFLSKGNILNENPGVSLNNLTKEDLLKLCNKYNNMTEIANELGTSRPTVRKYLEKFELLDEFKSKYNFHSISVIQYDIDGNTIKVWPSVIDASDTLGICHSSILKCINHERRSAGGYIWKKNE